MPDIESVRANISAPMSESPIETSYETICADERRPPSSAYFEFEDHPARIKRQHADRRDREDEEQPDVDVRDDAPVRRERDDGEDDEGRRDRDVGREAEDVRVGLVRHEVFLGQQLDGVGDGLQQPPLADAHRPQTRLHEGGDLALEVAGVERPHGDQRDDRADLYERPDDVVDRLRAEEPQQEVVEEVRGCEE